MGSAYLNIIRGGRESKKCWEKLIYPILRLTIHCSLITEYCVLENIITKKIFINKFLKGKE